MFVIDHVGDMASNVLKCVSVTMSYLSSHHGWERQMEKWTGIAVDIGKFSRR
jgi:hypothetical protein